MPMFNSLGKTPWEKDRLAIRVIGLAILSDTILRLEDIWQFIEYIVHVFIKQCDAEVGWSIDDANYVGRAIKSQLDKQAF